MLSRRLAFALAVAIPLVACDDDVTTDRFDGDIEVEADDAATVDVAAGPAGGVGGTADVTLSVPAGALGESVVLTVTPLTSMSGLPFDEDGAMAVLLGPSGTEFAVPVEVSFELEAGMTDVVGFTFDDDGSNMVMLPVDVSGSIATLQLAHFSGAGVAPACPARPLPLPAGPVSARARAQLAQLQREATCESREIDGPAAVLIVTDWYDASIRPRLIDAETDTTVLGPALAEYELWSATMQHVGISLDDLEDEALDLVAAAIGAAIARANDKCADQSKIAEAASVMRWIAVAMRLGVDGPEYGLDAATVLSNLCVKVVFEETTFPAEPIAGESNALAIQAGVSYLNGPVVYSPALHVTVTPSGTVEGVASGNTAGGVYSTHYTPTTAGGALSFEIVACVADPQHPTLSQICGTAIVAREAAGIEVELSDASVTLAPGASHQFSAEVTGTPNTAVNWSASCGAITAGGSYTAPASPTSCTVTASSVADPAKSDSAAVTVQSQRAARFISSTFSTRQTVQATASDTICCAVEQDQDASTKESVDSLAFSANASISASTSINGSSASATATGTIDAQVTVVDSSVQSFTASGDVNVSSSIETSGGGNDAASASFTNASVRFEILMDSRLTGTMTIPSSTGQCFGSLSILLERPGFPIEPLLNRSGTGHDETIDLPLGVGTYIVAAGTNCNAFVNSGTASGSIDKSSSFSISLTLTPN